MEFRRAEKKDVGDAARLAAEMWGGDPEDYEEELAQAAEGGEGAVFLAWEAGVCAGFAECGLRRDYVEGTDTSPVGYLEGVYVRPEYRRRGAGRALAALCEAWARAMGCREFASDCELDNGDSLAFHLSSGFEEANRIICFVKQL